ncbi:pyridoxamine 5'-phosphate oxidase family protein [Rhizobium sp. SSA_523]|uniref:pyridoxamine 5'-phosphate oxidase family protein n=1 Tax=Rhizobium sp. SSA_523 TaxID=2952477 RepID=UPI0020914FEC|nr:pyridoxamine 5'-phosphate oxidase family protein [Rhizobium sp. SSA_523]MCO5733439.1 pyridoxamine 5'-phosphate oxidase family protein [Rhizobium sp. SSA_523]WKC21591.1 pyridoxamine 5'-phosphate oxidase family protein [Rhizobium sp. SSA_523]
MAFGFLDVAVTPAVRAVQEELGVADMWADFKGNREFDRFTEAEAAFISSRDSFYMATVSETGWPYVQHRGGPQGFLKVLDDQTLAFADYRGNFQYISLGNLSANDKACLFLMDYPRRARLKIYVYADVVALDADPAMTDAVLAGATGKVERIIRLRLQNFDWNCPQHIVPRFTEAQMAAALQPIRDRLESLEAENARLRAQMPQG